MERSQIFDSVSILVVEDSEFHANLMQRILGMLGVADTVLAENGFEAIEILKEHPERFDAVITDIVMPVMGGFELVRAIRSGEVAGAEALPIVVVTGSNAEDESVHKEKLPDIAAYLRKPLKMEPIYDALLKVVEEKSKA
jgi:CheY-like chemotaxis protein